MIDMRLHSGRFVSLGKEDSPSVTLYSKKKKKGKKKKKRKKKSLFQIYSSAYAPQNGTRARCRRWRGRVEQWSQRLGGGETGHPGQAERAEGGRRAAGRGRRCRGDPRRELASAACCKIPRRLARVPSPPSATSRAGMVAALRAWRGAGGCVRAGAGGGGGGARRGQGAAGLGTGTAGGCEAVAPHVGTHTHTRLHTCTRMPSPTHTWSKPPADARPVVEVAEAQPCHGTASDAFVCCGPMPRPGSPPSPPGLQTWPCRGTCVTRNRCGRFPRARKPVGDRSVLSLGARCCHPMPCSWLQPSRLSRVVSPCPRSPLLLQARGGPELLRGCGQGRGQGGRVPHTNTCCEGSVAVAWVRRGHGGRGGRGCAHTQTKGWPSPGKGSVPAASASPAPPVQVPGLARDRGVPTGGERPPPRTLPKPPTVTHGCGRADGTWAGAGPRGRRAHPSRAGASVGAVPGHQFLGSLVAHRSPSARHRSSPSVAATFVPKVGAGWASPCPWSLPSPGAHGAPVLPVPADFG